MSVPGVSVTISGMESMSVLDQNLSILAGFKPLSMKEMDQLREHGKQFSDGRYELFKSTVKYDGDWVASSTIIRVRWSFQRKGKVSCNNGILLKFQFISENSLSKCFKISLRV
jgi:hypothetical protein